MARGGGADSGSILGFRVLCSGFRVEGLGCCVFVWVLRLEGSFGAD
jgi:hypothetical protein